MGGVLTNLMLAIVIVTSADPEGTRVDDTPMTIMIPVLYDHWNLCLKAVKMM